jgi:diguanylate cyclase (GGDEF)-like protein
MPSPNAAREMSQVGQRLKKQVQVAIVLSGILPLLVLAYVVHRYVLPQLSNAGDPTQMFALQGLIVCTMLAMIAGGWVIWDLGRSVAQMADAMGADATGTAQLAGIGTRTDEVGTLMQSFAKMLGTVGQQAAEINAFASKLDAAYKELEATNLQLKEYSFKDEVTGLYNRRFFTMRLDEELARYRRFNHPAAVVLLDLDGFKAVNDALGHAVGDETLRDIAQILQKHSRGINVVARYGGDEFAILLVETSKAGARLYAERMRQIIDSSPFSHGKPITASFGVASVPDDAAATVEDLFRAADEALYAAKRGGKNQVAAIDHREKNEPWRSPKTS